MSSGRSSRSRSGTIPFSGHASPRRRRRPRLSRLEGNLAKQRVQRRVREIVAAPDETSILDVGCVGPSPLAMWRWLFQEPTGRFRLTGVDVAGIERAQQVASRAGWSETRFVEASGYDLIGALGGERFDVVVSTQVLEHVRDVGRFLQQVAAVLKPGGRAFLTLDSGHHRRRRPPLRTLAKWLLVRLGAERHHERPLRVDELEPAISGAGLIVVDRAFFNIPPLKQIHNHEVGAPARDEVAALWYALEERLNLDASFIGRHRDYFLEIYYELAAPD